VARLACPRAGTPPDPGRSPRHSRLLLLLLLLLPLLLLLLLMMMMMTLLLLLLLLMLLMMMMLFLLRLRHRPRQQWHLLLLIRSPPVLLLLLLPLLLLSPRLEYRPWHALPRAPPAGCRWQWTALCRGTRCRKVRARRAAEAGAGCETRVAWISQCHAWRAVAPLGRLWGVFEGRRSSLRSWGKGADRCKLRFRRRCPPRLTCTGNETKK
jgi:hypothetical protein